MWIHEWRAVVAPSVSQMQQSKLATGPGAPLVLLVIFLQRNNVHHIGIVMPCWLTLNVFQISNILGKVFSRSKFLNIGMFKNVYRKFWPCWVKECSPYFHGFLRINLHWMGSLQRYHGFCMLRMPLNSLWTHCPVHQMCLRVSHNDFQLHSLYHLALKLWPI